MTRPVVFHVDAGTEVEEAAVWYETRRPGMCLAFVAAIDRVVPDLGENPARFPVWTPPWRRAVFRRFPYVVSVEIEEARVEVMAVAHSLAHARRRPGYWVAPRPPPRP